MLIVYSTGLFCLVTTTGGQKLALEDALSDPSVQKRVGDTKVEMPTFGLGNFFCSAALLTFPNEGIKGLCQSSKIYSASRRRGSEGLLWVGLFIPAVSEAVQDFFISLHHKTGSATCTQQMQLQQ